jgi:predicted nucleotidyltransferase
MMTQDPVRHVERVLRREEEVEAAWLFGSVAREEATTGSDLDVAVLGSAPLSSDKKATLIEELAQTTGRPVDLIDLQEAHGPIVGRILKHGTKLFCDDTTLYATFLTRWWGEQADWAPYRRRILKERRERWIERS